MMETHYLPTYLPIKQELPDTDPVVLDLCVRKEPPVTPIYPHDYRSRSPPTYADTCTSPNSVSGTSEASDLSSSESKDVNANVSSSGIKCSRPFKAFPKDLSPITLLSTFPTSILGKDSAEAYAEFRQKMLSQVQSPHNGTNKNMRRSQLTNSHVSDPTYWEKRRKNNEAAKRSRDARRAKEDEIAIRCAFLEQENMQLKLRLASLEAEMERFQRQFYH
ncbi:unnamed protein product [Acanthoscelides obtectus]|uniref:BZIP domain-containing protein n=1 Tax=Acanthoscelides obtectus TaxID=200917 RepID=A0A9P0KT88_ACAOB|nr:unnamed protein product [Acanthoscelides obtectus]CAK1643223.1 Protein giant [Acanthoscelides obtectus]